MRRFYIALVLLLTLLPLGLEVVAATPSDKNSRKMPPMLYPRKAIINRDGKPCNLTTYGQCCFFVFDKTRPATYQIPFDRNPAVDFMRFVNNGSHQCEFRMRAEIETPIRLDPGEALNTYLGGASKQVTLEIPSDQYCLISVFRESPRSYSEGLGGVCPSPPEVHAPFKKGAAPATPKSEEQPAAEPQPQQ